MPPLTWQMTRRRPLPPRAQSGLAPLQPARSRGAARAAALAAQGMRRQHHCRQPMLLRASGTHQMKQLRSRMRA